MNQRQIAALCLMLVSWLCLVACSGGDTATVPPAGEPEAGLSEPAPRSSVPDATPAARVDLSSIHMRPAFSDDNKQFQLYTQQFYDRDLDVLFEKFSDEMKTKVMPREALAVFRDNVESRYGREVRVLNEQAQEKGEYKGYARFARFDKHDGVIKVQWTVHKDDTIAGLIIEPVALSDVRKSATPSQE